MTKGGARVRVGLDIASVTEVQSSMERFGDRYLQRIYTPHELASCPGVPAVRARGLAARFAAKEAVIKVLRPIGAAPPWRTIEVRRAVGGWVELALSGSAAQLAESEGLLDFALSLTHEGDTASAVVIAQESMIRQQSPRAGAPR